MDTELERLARVETKIEGIVSDVKRIESKLDLFMQQFPSRAEVDEKLNTKEKEIESLWREIDDIKKGDQTKKAAAMGWSSIAIALASLVFSYIK